MIYDYCNGMMTDIYPLRMFISPIRSAFSIYVCVFALQCLFLRGIKVPHVQTWLSSISSLLRVEKLHEFAWQA